MSFPNPRITPASVGPGGGMVGDFVYFNDFLVGGEAAGGLIDQAVNTGDWYNENTNDGLIVIADAEPGGVLHITTDTADEDGYEIQMNGESFQVAADKDIFWEMRVKFTAASPLTTIDWALGLANTTVTVLPGTNLTEFIGFRTGAVGAVPINAGAADITCSMGNSMAGSWTASTISEADTGVNWVDDTFLTLAFHLIGNQRVRFYVDGNEKATFTTNIPDGDNLTPTIAIQNNGSFATQMLIDYIYVAQVR